MTAKFLKVLIVDANRIRAAIIAEGLHEAGLDSVVIVHDAQEVMRRIVEIDPDVIVIDLEDPSRDQLEHMFQVSRAVKRPIAMFVDRSDDASLEAAIQAGVSAYIVDGLRKDRVKGILDMAVVRFRAFDRLQRELDEARSALEDRKRIDRAKAILMRSRSLTEPEAYALLRRTAMNQNRRIADIAESLILAHGLLDEGGNR